MKRKLKEGPCGVYRHINAAGETIYIGCSVNPMARLASHGASADWITEVVRVDIEWFPSQAEALAVEERLIRAECPPNNRYMTPRRAKWPETEGGAKLRAWMIQNGVGDADLARALGVARSAIRGLFTPNASPRYLKQFQIAVITGGEVGADSWERKTRFARQIPPKESAKEAAEWLIRFGHPVPPILTAATPARSAA